MPNNYGTATDIRAKLDRESLDARIAQARQNLGIGSLFGLLGVLGQNTNESIPAYNDRFIDSRIKEVPQYLKDQAAYDIDKTLRTTTNGILSTLAPNRAANILAVANANALGAKSRLAVDNARQDIALKNQYYDLKNASLNKYNNSVADRLNRIRNNRNQQIAGVGALGTNYYNELQKSINRVNALKDQNYVNSSMLNSFLPILESFKMR